MNERGVVAVPFRVALGFLLLLCLWSFLGEQFSGLDSNPNEYDVELLEKKRHNMTKVKASRGEFLESCRSCPCYDRDVLIPVGALPQSHSHKLLLSHTLAYAPAERIRARLNRWRHFWPQLTPRVTSDRCYERLRRIGSICPPRIEDNRICEASHVPTH